MKKEKIYFAEKYYNIRKVILFVGILVMILLMVAFCMSMFSAGQMKEIISEDFNQQQLVLAKYAANRMENSLDFIKRELLLLNLSPSIQYLEKVSWASRMNTTLYAVKDDGVLEIKFINHNGKTAHIVDERGMPHVIQGHFADTNYYKWASLKKNENRIYVSEITKESGQYPEKLVMILATPTYEQSVDDAYPVAAGNLSGVLIFIIDVTRLVEKTVKFIKSGKTGYAWVIDSKGVFLYHPQREFIGNNAFSARAMKKPRISFSRINMIQKEKMLEGKEGTGRYTSGWHRSVEIEMKKLIAYAPVYPHAYTQFFWSVAVVAPLSEIEESVHLVFIRQLYIQGSILLAIIFGSIYIINFERRWSRTLEAEVMKKTDDLKNSLEEQMYNTERLASLGTLSAGVAHELNNPIAIIVGFSELLLEKMESDSKSHEILETIDRQALNCKKIVESILSYARRPEIIEHSADANENIEKVFSVVENILVTKKITLEKHLAKDLPKARGDSGYLQQVFMNFITNAFGAMKGGGILTVSTSLNSSKNKIEIFFKDTGYGIKREYRNKIFDAFFTTKKVGEGTGLGLSVSYGIIKKYGGDIIFNTVAEEEDMAEKGTTFIVSLPVVYPDSKQQTD